MTLACFYGWPKSLGYPVWSYGLNRMPQISCKAGVCCFLYHMLILNTGLNRYIMFPYSANRIKKNTRVVWTTLCRLTFPDLLVCNSFTTDLRNVLLKEEIALFRLVYVYNYLIKHTHIYVYMPRCACTWSL